MQVCDIETSSPVIDPFGRCTRRLARIASTVCALAIGLNAVSAVALTIDFGESEQWIDPFSRTETYDFGTGMVRISITDPNNSLSSTATGAAGPAPATHDYLNPPDNALNNPNPQSLFLRTQGNGRGQSAVVVRIEFLFVGGVTDIQFDMFDIDRGAGQWRDRIRLRSVDLFGTRELPTSVSSVGVGAPVWVYNTNNGAVRGTGDSSGGPGNATDSGTARVQFAGGTYSEIEIQYANTDAAQGTQWISISDISFIPLLTPEPSPALLVTAGLLVMAGFRRHL